VAVAAQEQQRQGQAVTEKGCNNNDNEDEKAEQAETESITEESSSKADPCQNDANSSQLLRMSVGQVLADLIVDEVITEAMQRVDRSCHNDPPPKTFDELFEPSVVVVTDDEDSREEDGGQPGHHTLIVHRNVVDEDEASGGCEVIVRASSTDDEEPFVDQSDQHGERLNELENDVATLQECLEVAEAHVDKVEAELQREKSKVELIEHELKSREKIMRMVLSEKNRQLKDAEDRAVSAEKKAHDSHLNHQDQLEMYQTQLKEKESEIREKEESNHMLRRDMLEIMNRFNNEKVAMEAKVEEAKAKLITKVTNSATPTAEQQPSKDIEKRLKTKHIEVKILKKEVLRLRSELEIHNRTSDRAKKIALILDAIDSID